jgi:hypothetical protein
VLVAIAAFSPVLIWNAQHDWASFRFQGVRATASYGISLRTIGDYIGLQFGLVGFVMLPVVLTGLVLTAWRGYRTREPVAILLSTAVLVPFLYFLVKSMTLRVGDTWPMFMWPVGFAAAAVNLATMTKEGWSARMLESSLFWARTAIVSGIAFVVIVFLYYVAAPWNFLGKSDPIGAEAGFEQVAARAQAALDETGATWIATTDYRTYAMMRWLFRGRVPVIELNERGRFQDFRDPGMDRIRGHAGIYVGREPDNRSSLWENIPAKREQLGEVERRWRGVLADTYVIEKLTGWAPELSPPKDSPLFQWKVLAGEFDPKLARFLLPSPGGSHKERVSESRYSSSFFRIKSVARADSFGGGSAANGSGLVTSIAARPNRAVSNPFSTPSPNRCDSFAAMPWPSICCTRLSLAAMPPVMARWAMT